jgi:hypothetical protein
MTVLSRLSLLPLMLLTLSLVAGCSLLEARLLTDPPEAQVTTSPAESGGDRFPDVLAVELRPRGDRVFDVAVTISSPYDTPQRYADGWRVLDPQGNVLGTHMLMHDHAAEQPFTRTQTGLHIPAATTTITVEGRDQANGFGGLSLTVEVPE